MAGVWSRWLTVATTTQSICAGLEPGVLEGLARGRDAHHLHGLVRSRPAALLDARPLLDPLVAGVDRVDHLGVGDHARGPVGADPEDAGVPRCLRLLDVRFLDAGLLRARRGSRRSCRASCGVEPDQGLARGDEVAVLDEPLGDLAAVPGDDGRPVAAAGDVADRRAGASSAASTASGCRWKVPLPGETTIRQVGEVSNALASPCLSQKSRAASSWSGVLSANVSTPLRLRLAMPVRVPAGGISRMPVTRRSLMVSMQRSQRTGLAIWPTIRATTSRPSWTTLPSLLEITGMRGSCGRHRARQLGESGHGRLTCGRCGTRPPR